MLAALAVFLVLGIGGAAYYVTQMASDRPAPAPAPAPPAPAPPKPKKK